MVNGTGILILTLAYFVQGSQYTGQVFRWDCAMLLDVVDTGNSEDGDWVDGWVMWWWWITHTVAGGAGGERKSGNTEGAGFRIQDSGHYTRLVCVLRVTWRWLVIVSCLFQDETSIFSSSVCPFEAFGEWVPWFWWDLFREYLDSQAVIWKFFSDSVMTFEFEQAMCGGLLPNLETFPKSNLLVQNVEGIFLLNSHRK